MTPWLALPALGAPEVTLLGAGAEPRVPLRYEVAPGSTERITVTSIGDTKIEVGGLLPDPPPSRSERTLQLSLAAGGTAEAPTLRLSIDAVTAKTEPAPARTPDVPPESLAGSWCEVALDPRGLLADPQWHLTPAVPEAKRASVDTLLSAVVSLIVALPAEPVGVGGRWRVRDAVRAGPLALAVETTWTLAAADVSGWTLTGTSSAAPAAEGTPFDEGGLRGTIEALALEGSSTVTLPRGALVGSRTAASEIQADIRGTKGILPFRLALEIEQSQHVAPR
jgi:hypothetical protein